MKRQTRIGLSILAAGTAAILYPCLAAAQIAPPTVSAVPGASADSPFELFRGSRIVLTGQVNGVETPMMLDSGAGVTTLDDDFAKQWLVDLGNPYVAVAADREGRTAIDFGVYGAPETFFIDEHGIVQYRHVGPLTREVWEREFLARLPRGAGP